MNTSSHHTWLRPGLYTAILSIAMAAAPNAARAVSLTLDPLSQDVSAGSLFSLTVGIQGLGDFAAPSLGTFDLDVNFDPALVRFESITFGDPTLGDLLGPVTPSVTGSGLNGPGDALNLFSVSLDTPAELNASQPSEFTLASLWFTALAVGSGGFTIDNVILGDADGSPLTLDGTRGAEVNITARAVPEGSVGIWTTVLTLGALTFGRSRLSRGVPRPAGP